MNIQTEVFVPKLSKSNNQFPILTVWRISRNRFQEPFNWNRSRELIFRWWLSVSWQMNRHYRHIPLLVRPAISDLAKNTPTIFQGRIKTGTFVSKHYRLIFSVHVEEEPPTIRSMWNCSTPLNWNCLFYTFQKLFWAQKYISVQPKPRLNVTRCAVGYYRLVLLNMTHKNDVRDSGGKVRKEFREIYFVTDWTQRKDWII